VYIVSALQLEIWNNFCFFCCTVDIRYCKNSSRRFTLVLDQLQDFDISLLAVRVAFMSIIKEMQW